MIQYRATIRNPRRNWHSSISAPNKMGALKNSDGNPWLFISSHSILHHMSAMNAKKMMVKYGALAGLDRDKSHPLALRNSCAIHMLMNGSDIYDVQSHLGHTSVNTTIQYCSQFDHKDWIAKIGDRLEK